MKGGGKGVKLISPPPPEKITLKRSNYIRVNDEYIMNIMNIFFYEAF